MRHGPCLLRQFVRSHPKPLGQALAPAVRLRLALLALGALVLLSPVSLRSWRYADDALITVDLGAAERPMRPADQADLDSDGLVETVQLDSGKLTILSDGQARWQSPGTWSVRQAALSDLNRDGRPEVSLLVWRAFQPWPTDRLLPHAGRIDTFHNATGQSCHLILIGADGRGGYRELWAGSALADPIVAFDAADLDGDGHQELVTLEGRYEDSAASPARAVKVWEWDGFGFTSTAGIDRRVSRIVVLPSGASQQVIAQVAP